MPDQLSDAETGCVYGVPVSTQFASLVSQLVVVPYEYECAGLLPDAANGARTRHRKLLPEP